jgi:hypothetical protein
MSRGNQTFRQADLSKAVRAAQKVMEIDRVEIDRGRIVIFPKSAPQKPLSVDPEAA